MSQEDEYRKMIKYLRDAEEGDRCYHMEEVMHSKDEMMMSWEHISVPKYSDQEREAILQRITDSSLYRKLDLANKLCDFPTELPGYKKLLEAYERLVIDINLLFTARKLGYDRPYRKYYCAFLNSFQSDVPSRLRARPEVVQTLNDFYEWSISRQIGDYFRSDYVIYPPLFGLNPDYIGNQITLRAAKQRIPENLLTKIASWTLDDFIGQSALVKALKAKTVENKAENSVFPHIYLEGADGIGKATLARAIAGSMGYGFWQASAQEIKEVANCARLLSNLSAGDVLVIEEYNDLSETSRALLTEAIKQNKLTIPVEEGDNARSVIVNLPAFTLVGTSTGSLTLIEQLEIDTSLVHRPETMVLDDEDTSAWDEEPLVLASETDPEAGGAESTAADTVVYEPLSCPPGFHMAHRFQDYTKEELVQIAQSILEPLTVEELGSLDDNPMFKAGNTPARVYAYILARAERPKSAKSPRVKQQNSGSDILSELANSQEENSLWGQMLKFGDEIQKRHEQVEAELNAYDVRLKTLSQENRELQQQIQAMQLRQGNGNPAQRREAKRQLKLLSAKLEQNEIIKNGVRFKSSNIKL